MTKHDCPDCNKPLHLNIETDNFYHYACLYCNKSKPFDKQRKRFLTNSEMGVIEKGT